MSESTIAIRIDSELHKQLKAKLAVQGISLKDYLTKVIENEISQEGPPLNLDDLRQCARQIQEHADRILEMANRE